MLGNGTVSIAFSAIGLEVKINKTYKSSNQEIAYTTSLVLTISLLPDSHLSGSSMPQLSVAWKNQSLDFLEIMKKACVELKWINVSKWILGNEDTIAMFVGVIVIFTVGEGVLAAGAVGGMIGGVLEFAQLIQNTVLSRGK